MTQTPTDALRLVPDGLTGEAKAAHIAVQRDEAIRIAHRLHQTCESLIYGLPKYLEQTAQTDEENMIGKAWHTFDAAAWQLAALPEPENTEPCFECGSVERIGTACAPCNPEIADRGTASWFRAEAGRLGCDNWRGPQRLREAADRIAALEAAPASPLPGGGWQDISTAPKDGTLILGCDLDHPSFGSWPMYRRVKHGFNDAGEVLTQDMGAWIKIIDVEPDFEGGSDVGFEPQYAIAPDDLNKSVRYGWKPFPIPETPTKAEAK